MKKCYTAVALAAFLQTGISAQCLVTEVSLDERIDDAYAVFEGRVLEKASFWNDSYTSIYTANTVEVYKVFKGRVASSVTEVITPGGIVGDAMEIVTPSLELTPGQTGIFLVRRSGVLQPGSPLSESQVFEPWYGPQAFIKYDLAEGFASDFTVRYNDIPGELYAAIIRRTGRNYTERKRFSVCEVAPRAKTSAAPSITGFTPTTVTAGTLTEITINGMGFGTNTGSAKVEFKNADDGGSTYNAVLGPQIVSWTSTQIKAKVPSKCGTGTIRVTDSGGASATSSSSVTMTYGQLTSVDGSNIENRVKLANQNGSGGYSLKYCNSFNATSGAVASFDRALETWRCATYFNYGPTGTTANACNARDGNNIVNWDNAGGCAVSSNTLGITNSYYNACGTGGNWYWTLTEMDVRFNNTKSWNYGPGATTGGKYDFQTIASHEIGHTHGLAHVIDPPALMHWSRNTNTDIRTLSAGSDIAGGNEVMTRSGGTNNPCGPSAHIKLNATTCTVGIDGVEQASGAITVFPNPFAGSATVYVPASLLGTQGLSFSLFDVLGNRVQSIVVASPAVVLDGTGLAPGVYFYRVGKEDAVISSGKLIVAEGN